jgi:hypothetical protein
MPVRGSMQLLLRTLRVRAACKAWVGGVTAGLLVIGGMHLEKDLAFRQDDGFSNAIRQTVWEKALSDQSQPGRWPWDEISDSMALKPNSKVPRLGLSAALVSKESVVTTGMQVRTSRVEPPSAPSQAQGDLVLNNVTVGDAITFTAADGATCVYRVTGRRVVDPHLAESQAERFAGEAGLFECGPLESLILRATQGEADAPPHTVFEQRKL